MLAKIKIMNSSLTIDDRWITYVNTTQIEKDRPPVIIIIIIFNRTQSTKTAKQRSYNYSAELYNYVYISAIMSVIWDFVKVKLSGNTL
jgi:hypothetical protein